MLLLAWVGFAMAAGPEAAPPVQVKPAGRLQEGPPTVRWVTPEGIVGIKQPVLTVDQSYLTARLLSQSVADGEASFRYQFPGTGVETPANYELRLSGCRWPRSQA
jgi:hypothetical protein